MVDSAGKGFLTRQDFAQCWFQLVDLHTDDISSDLYASWILKVVEKIAHKRMIGTVPETSRASGSKMWVWEWRDDLAVLSRAGGLAPLPPKQNTPGATYRQTPARPRHRQGRASKKQESVKARLPSQAVAQIRLQWESSFKVERSTERLAAARRSADAAHELTEQSSVLSMSSGLGGNSSRASSGSACSTPSSASTQPLQQVAARNLRKHRFLIPGCKHARAQSSATAAKVPMPPPTAPAHPPLRSQEAEQQSLREKPLCNLVHASERATCAPKQQSWRFWRPRSPRSPKEVANDVGVKQSHKIGRKSFMAPMRPAAAHAYQVLRRSFHL